MADTGKNGKVTGAEAKAFFKRTRLPSSVLARIWGAADEKKKGYLRLPEFCNAMWLVALAQAGVSPVSRASLTRLEEYGHPLPQLVGINCEGSVPKEETKKQKEKKADRMSGVPKVKAKMDAKQVDSIADGLQQLYFKYVRPLEEAYSFHVFHTPLLKVSDFSSKPLVTLLGQYSTGKTTFTEYILGQKYPSAQVGPEPTTDRFVAIMHANDERMIPGNTLTVQTDKPYTGLTKFGGQFLNKFCGAELDSDLLEYVDIIDTPGVLSGEKQSIERQYDFPSVVRWFAERSDLVLVLFDPHKLDISDEFKRTILALQGFDDKVKVVLNKADQVDTQHLMRVYGALLWSLSRVFRTPEVPRVYVGNFREGEYVNKDLRKILNLDRETLIKDIQDIPRTAVARKVNEFVKRVRAAKIHALILSALRERMPSLGMGAKAKQQKLIDRLEETFLKVQQEHGLAVGDFPPLEPFREKLRGHKLDGFPKFSKDQLAKLDAVLEVEIPSLMNRFGNPFD